MPGLRILLSLMPGIVAFLLSMKRQSISPIFSPIEIALLRAFYYFIENNNNFDKFGEGLGYIRLALIFIPSMIAPFKPRDFAIDMYKEWYQVDNPRGTMHVKGYCSK